MNYNIILNESKELVNKSTDACFVLMAGTSAIVCILVLAGVFPAYALISLSGYVPLIILLSLLRHHNKEKLNTISKKIELSEAASKAKQVMEPLVQGFGDTYVNDNCRTKMKHLSDNGVDTGTALKQINNNVELYNKLAADFLQESNILEDELYTLMHSQSLSHYASKVHELREKSNALGFKHLADAALFHELEACIGDLSILESNWEKLSFELDEANSILEEYIKSLNDNDKLTRKMWGERLQEAFNALEAFDTDKATEILNELIESPLNPNITVLLKNLVTNINEVMAT
jgi:HPt (histidine-containing phosphotransfer) domain-containing protein